MKTVKLIIAAAICASVLGACKSSTCPGYGGIQKNYGKVVKAEVKDIA